MCHPHILIIYYLYNALFNGKQYYYMSINRVGMRIVVYLPIYTRSGYTAISIDRRSEVNLIAYRHVQNRFVLFLGVNLAV